MKTEKGIKEQELVKLVNTLLKLIGRKSSLNEIREILLKNPLFPNIGAFTSLLSELNINNKIGRININQINQLEPHFVAQLFNEGLVIVSQITDHKIKYYNAKNGWVEGNLDEFNRSWNGIVVLFDTSKPKKEKNKKRIMNLRTPIAIGIPLAFILYLIIDDFVFENLFLITKTLGVTIGLILSHMEISIMSDSKFCQIKSSSKVNCRNVLDSKAAKITSYISLSDIGLVYFLSTLIYILLPEIGLSDTQNSSIIAYLSIFSMPFIFYSVYEQYKLRVWCTLCLAIVLILLLEGIGSLCLINNILIINYITPVLSLIFVFIIIIIFWSLFKNKFEEYYKFKYIYYQYFRIKNNPEIFETLLDKESTVNLELLKYNLLLFDNLSINKIFLVINPYCEYCGKEFNELYNFKENYKFGASLIFSPSRNSQITLILIELYYKLSENDFLDMLKKWFETKDEELLKTGYPITISDKAIITFEDHSEWCRNNKIMSTPKVLYKNRYLPDIYSISDIQRFF